MPLFMKFYLLQVFQWYRSEQDLPAAEMVDVTNVGIGENHIGMEEKDYTDNRSQSEKMIVFGVWHK